MAHSGHLNWHKLLGQKLAKLLLPKANSDDIQSVADSKNRVEMKNFLYFPTCSGPFMNTAVSCI